MQRLRPRPAEVRNDDRRRKATETVYRTNDRQSAVERYTDGVGSDVGGDDMGERDREIGRRVHGLIAGFCARGVVPEPTQVWVATGRLFAARPMPLNQSSRQRAACATSVFFTRFHRPGWTFLGAEVVLEEGRADLLWQLPDGRVVIDELKSGSIGAVVEDRRTLEQVERYRQAGVRRFGADFAGVRLLPLTSPGRARFHPAVGPAVDLAAAAQEVR